MDLADFHFLLSTSGKRWLDSLADTVITPQNHLQLAVELRKELSPAYTQAVLETTLLRQLGKAKFSRAQHMFFTRPALEQASSEIVSQHRAQRFAHMAYRQVADLGCSIGGDALTLAAQTEVIGVDWDPLRIEMAQENVRVYGHGEQFRPLQADLLELTPLSVDAIFFDPARRDERGRRFYSVHDYQPPLSLIDHWREKVGDTAVKISPGVAYEEIPLEAEIEFISVDGGVKEGVLWYGALHSGVTRRATLLPGGVTLTDQELPDGETAVTPPRAYLYEPDGAVIRAHLVEAVAQQLNATKLDTDIAYLTADKAVATPFARCFAVEDYFPFQLKRLRHYLRERNIGQVVVKKRGSPLEPERLIKQLRLNGSDTNQCILFLTQLKGEAAVIVAREEKNKTPDA